MSIDSKSKNPWIQILRAISVLAVIAYHFELPISNGFIGVDIFFVISGYVITQSLTRSSENTWFTRLKLFYIKRIARLFHHGEAAGQPGLGTPIGRRQCFGPGKKAKGRVGIADLGELAALGQRLLSGP